MSRLLVAMMLSLPTTGCVMGLPVGAVAARGTPHLRPIPAAELQPGADVRIRFEPEVYRGRRPVPVAFEFVAFRADSILVRDESDTSAARLVIGLDAVQSLEVMRGVGKVRSRAAIGPALFGTLGMAAGAALGATIPSTERNGFGGQENNAQAGILLGGLVGGVWGLVWGGKAVPNWVPVEIPNRPGP